MRNFSEADGQLHRSTGSCVVEVSVCSWSDSARQRSVLAIFRNVLHRVSNSNLQSILASIVLTPTLISLSYEGLREAVVAHHLLDTGKAYFGLPISCVPCSAFAGAWFCFLKNFKRLERSYRQPCQPRQPWTRCCSVTVALSSNFWKDGCVPSWYALLPIDFFIGLQRPTWGEACSQSDRCVES